MNTVDWILTFHGVKFKELPEEDRRQFIREYYIEIIESEREREGKSREAFLIKYFTDRGTQKRALSKSAYDREASKLRKGERPAILQEKRHNKTNIVNVIMGFEESCESIWQSVEWYPQKNKIKAIELPTLDLYKNLLSQDSDFINAEKNEKYGESLRIMFQYLEQVDRIISRYLDSQEMYEDTYPTEDI